MTENELELLGFEKQIITDDESQNGYDFHFYVYKVVDGLTFVSCANDEAELDDFAIENWHVEIAETNPQIKFTEFAELQGIINLLENKING
jgi:hypothetical protein